MENNIIRTAVKESLGLRFPENFFSEEEISACISNFGAILDTLDTEEICAIESFYGCKEKPIEKPKIKHLNKALFKISHPSRLKVLFGNDMPSKVLSFYKGNKKKSQRIIARADAYVLSMQERVEERDVHSFLDLSTRSQKALQSYWRYNYAGFEKKISKKEVKKEVEDGSLCLNTHKVGPKILTEICEWSGANIDFEAENKRRRTEHYLKMLESMGYKVTLR